MLFFFKNLSTSLLVALSLWTLIDWITYTAEAGDFKILAPETMQVQYDTVNSGIGTIFAQNYYCKSATDTTETLYTISYLDYPEYTIHSDSTDLVDMYFEQTSLSMEQELNGKLAYASKDATADYPTYVWKVVYDNEQKVAKFKSIIIGKKIYLLRVSKLNLANTERETKRFMDSFRYTGLNNN